MNSWVTYIPRYDGEGGMTIVYLEVPDNLHEELQEKDDEAWAKFIATTQSLVREHG